MTKSMSGRLSNEIRAAFLEGLDLPQDAEVENLRFGEHPHWDSLGHMTLLETLEAKFAVVLQGDDAMRIDTFPAALTVLCEMLGNKSAHPGSLESKDRLT